MKLHLEVKRPICSNHIINYDYINHHVECDAVYGTTAVSMSQYVTVFSEHLHVKNICEYKQLKERQFIRTVLVEATDIQLIKYRFFVSSSVIHLLISSLEAETI